MNNPEDCTPASSLHRLAELAGIQPSYYDHSGTLHITSDETRASLLKAMGFPTTEPEIHDAVQDLETRSWRRVVAPVIAVRSTTVEIPVTLPANLWHKPLTWTVELEDGSVQEGKVAHTTPDEQANGNQSVYILDDQLFERRVVRLQTTLPLGYHQLSIGQTNPLNEEKALLIVAPSAAWLPNSTDNLENAGKLEQLEQIDANKDKNSKKPQNKMRDWGLQIHLYSLRSEENEGIGDFVDLKAITELGQKTGASLIGINPLHALFPEYPENASPYYPSSRHALNPIYIRLSAVPEFSLKSGMAQKIRKTYNSAIIQKELKRLRQSDHVDYTGVIQLKWPLLEQLFHCFEQEADKKRKAEFETFIAEGGETLSRFALYVVLLEHFSGKAWLEWPEAFRNPNSAEVEQFAQEHQDKIRFQLYLQWEAERQLADSKNDMLYQDLAIGTAADGADVWMNPDIYTLNARFGAPPDPLAPQGQDWGMPPLHPIQLQENRYRPFIEMIGANMRHAKALRIDHAMGLMRLFWIPQEKDCAGTYVHYPFDDILAILALESHRNCCMLIGEDLGTVPDGFRERMERENILSYRLFWFERHESGFFKRPDTWPEKALATIASHDMSPFSGFWKGYDLELRQNLKLIDSEEAWETEVDIRDRDRNFALGALEDQGLIPHEEKHDLQKLMLALHKFLAASPACLMMVNLDDLLEETTPLNLPGTVDEYPNWRRKLSQPVGKLADLPLLKETLGVVRKAR